MIRNQVTEQLIRFNGTHYKRLLRKQNEPGSPKYFLKKDIVRLSDESKSTRNTRAGGSNNASDAEMTNVDDVKCEVCFDDVPLIALIDLGCQGGHRACAKCIHQWCVEKLPTECSCPFCRQPVRSHEALKRYMTDDMIRLYTSEQTPENRAEFVFRSADIKFKTFEDTSATEFERMTEAELLRVSDSLTYYDEYVRGHVAILKALADNRNRRRLKRMGEKMSDQLFCMDSFAIHGVWVKQMSSLENARRDEINQLINRQLNIRNYRPENLVTSDDLSTYEGWREHNITIRGQWMLYDDFDKVATYLNVEHAVYKMSLTHMYRKEFLRFRLYQWLSDLFAFLPDEFKILDSAEVRTEADYLFMVDPQCRSYSKFEHHTPKPVEITFKLSLPDTPVNAAIVRRLSHKSTLHPTNKLHTNNLHPSPEVLPVDQRIPWLYKFHIDRITSQ